MGCGASKAAQVSEEDINIVNHPATRRRSVEREVDMNRNAATTEDIERHEDDGGVDPVYSGQSEIERAVKEAASFSTNTTTPSISSNVATTNTIDNHLHQPTVPASTSAPMVFEVCMSADDRLEPRAQPPPRLKKLESAPVVTTEMLEMKQHRVAERKKEELEKRLGRSRMSKKDRLRREIMAAREMHPSESGEDIALTESFNYSRLTEEPVTTMGEEGEKKGRENDNFKLNAHTMEGDTVYNTEGGGGAEFWDEDERLSSSNKAIKDTKLEKQDSNSLQGSTDNLEEYM